MAYEQKEKRKKELVMSEGPLQNFRRPSLFFGQILVLSRWPAWRARRERMRCQGEECRGAGPSAFIDWEESAESNRYVTRRLLRGLIYFGPWRKVFFFKKKKGPGFIDMWNAQRAYDENGSPNYMVDTWRNRTWAE